MSAAMTNIWIGSPSMTESISCALSNRVSQSSGACASRSSAIRPRSSRTSSQSEADASLLGMRLCVEELDKHRSEDLGVHIVALALEDARPAVLQGVGERLSRLAHPREVGSSGDHQGGRLYGARRFGRQRVVAHDPGV